MGTTGVYRQDESYDTMREAKLLDPTNQNTKYEPVGYLSLRAHARHAQAENVRQYNDNMLLLAATPVTTCTEGIPGASKSIHCEKRAPTPPTFESNMLSLDPPQFTLPQCITGTAITPFTRTIALELPPLPQGSQERARSQARTSDTKHNAGDAAASCASASAVP